MYTFWGLLPPDGILPRAKFTLRPSLALFYIGSVPAWHSSIGPQPNFVAWYKEWNYGTFTEGATYIRLGGQAITLGIGLHSSYVYVLPFLRYYHLLTKTYRGHVTLNTPHFRKSIIPAKTPRQFPLGSRMSSLTGPSQDSRRMSVSFCPRDADESQTG